MSLTSEELRDVYDGSTMAGEWHWEISADLNTTIKATGIQATSFKDYKEAFAVLNGNHSRYLFDTAIAELNIGLKH